MGCLHQGLPKRIKAEVESPTVKQILTVEPQPVLVAGVHTPPETKEEIESEIRRVFGHLADEAVCIAFNESGLRADATNHNANGSWDVGVFQINDIHGMSWEERLDARKNIRKAYEIRMAWGNWSAWMAAPKCGL